MGMEVWNGETAAANERPRKSGLLHPRWNEMCGMRASSQQTRPTLRRCSAMIACYWRRHLGGSAGRGLAGVDDGMHSRLKGHLPWAQAR